MHQISPKVRPRSVAQCPPRPSRSEPTPRHNEKFPFRCAEIAKEIAAAKRFDPQTEELNQVRSMRFYQYFRSSLEIGQGFFTSRREQNRDLWAGLQLDLLQRIPPGRKSRFSPGAVAGLPV